MTHETAPAPEVAVGAVVIRERHLLMVKRARPPAAGLWTVPGGRVKSGEYIADAVRREVLEETGIEVKVGDLLGVFEVIGEVHYVILDHLAEPTEPDPRPVAADDAAAAEWVAFDELGSRPCTPRLVEMLRGWGVLQEGHPSTSA